MKFTIQPIFVVLELVNYTAVLEEVNYTALLEEVNYTAVAEKVLRYKKCTVLQ